MMSGLRKILTAFFCVLLLGSGAGAHALRPAFVLLNETEPGHFDVTWKVPSDGVKPLALNLLLPTECENTRAPAADDRFATLTLRWTISCKGGLNGRRIGIEGLSAAYTEALVRVERGDGTVQTARLTPDFPSVEITAAPTTLGTARTYFLLGVQHILLGLDHLMFVLALLLLIGRPRTLVATVTAFTVAHSITLAFAALGLAQAPQAPVEALIALSIAFVASEIIRKERGYRDLSSRSPWIIAFLFGLLHGFGFGGALKEIGLPQKDVPLALLTFNLGVEAGQLAFIFVVLLAGACLGLLVPVKTRAWRYPVSYVIGSVSAFWFVWRVASF